jgi:Ran GTPase-activating protein (RanGAP) involved in mRNA processing and transport
MCLNYFSHSLGGNRIGPEGGRRVARVLLRLPRPLHALAMDSCGLGDDGGAAIAKAMRVNRIIEQLE